LERYEKLRDFIAFWEEEFLEYIEKGGLEEVV
jgi:hypothetical protein